MRIIAFSVSVPMVLEPFAEIVVAVVTLDLAFEVVSPSVVVALAPEPLVEHLVASVAPELLGVVAVPPGDVEPLVLVDVGAPDSEVKDSRAEYGPEGKEACRKQKDGPPTLPPGTPQSQQAPHPRPGTPD